MWFWGDAILDHMGWWLHSAVGLGCVGDQKVRQVPFEQILVARGFWLIVAWYTVGPTC